MINAIKKILQGETAFTLTDLGSGTVSATELAANAVTAAKINASAVGLAALKYGRYPFSLAGDGSAGPAGTGKSSAAISIVVTAGAQIIGWYLTKFVCTSAASYTNLPYFVSTASTCITVSPCYGLKSTADVIEGVILTIE